MQKEMAYSINAESENIVHSRGCTESIKMVAGGLENGLLKEGNEIPIAALEHHAYAVKCAGYRLRFLRLLRS
jgi:selenocysteine lyase/cysteine desulfurase